MTSSTSMEDDDLLFGSQDKDDKQTKSKSNTTKRKRGQAEKGTEDNKLSSSSDSSEGLEKLMKEQKKAEKHKQFFDVEPYQYFSCFANFNPLDVLPRSRYVAEKLWRCKDNKSI